MIREVLIYVQQQLVDHHSYPHPLQLRRLWLSCDEQLRLQLQLLLRLVRQDFASLQQVGPEEKLRVPLVLSFFTTSDSNRIKYVENKQFVKKKLE